MIILVAGYYGFGNLGDELILSVLLSQLKETYADPEVVVLSNTPAHTQFFHKAKAVFRWNPLAILFELWRADLFVLGGGGLLQDKTSFRSLLYYLSLVAVARLAGKSIFLYCVGVETLQRPLSRRFVRLLLSSPKVKITVRDRWSMDKLIIAGVPEKSIELRQDPVFSLPLRVAPREPHFYSLQRVLFIPRLPAPASGLALYNEVRFLFEGRLGVQVDEVVFEPRVEKKMRPTARSIEDLDQMVPLLSSCDLVVSARYHGLVLAALADRPFIGMGDVEKTGRLCDALKMPFVGWNASQRELEAALGRVMSNARRRDLRVSQLI